MDTVTPLPRLSASKIKMFFQCRLLYYRTYTDREESIQNPSAILGSALHKAIELYYIEKKNPIHTFENTFDRMLAEAGQNIKVFNNIAGIRKSGITMLGNMDWAAIKPLGLEVRFSLPFPNAENPICIITGFMDIVTEDGYIIDHKSSSKLPDIDSMANDTQFVIYYWAYEQLYGKKPNGVIWNHLRTGIFHNTNVHKYINRKLAKLTKDIHTVVSATQFDKKPTRDSFCKNLCGLDNECWGK